MVSHPMGRPEPSKMSFDHGIVHPAYSGVVFLLSWIYLLLYANSAGIEAAAPISLMGAPYTLSSICMCAVILLISFGPGRFASDIMGMTLKIAAPVATSAGTVLMIAGGVFSAYWAQLAGAAVTGAFSGVMALQWVVAYRRVGLKTLICSFPALMALAICLCMTLMYLPAIIMLVATVVFPLVSGIMLHTVRRVLYPTYEIDAHVSDRPTDFALVVFPVSIFAFSSGFLDYFSGESGYTFFFYVFVSVVLLLTACVFIFIVNRENAFVCIVLPLCFLVCEFVPFSVMIDNIPAAHFISIGELGIEIALFAVAVGFAEFFSLSSLKTYALCRVAQTVLNAAGWYVSAYSSSAFSELLNSQASLAVVFIGIEVISVCLIVAIVKAQKTLPADATMASTGVNPAGDMPPADGAERMPVSDEAGSAGMAPTGGQRTQHEGAEAAKGLEKGERTPAPTSLSVEDKCRRLAGVYALSNREMDVFLLLARGYTSAGIQSELYIAAGTVNYHTRNIYAKLGVHSKQELISLVSES